MRFGFSASIKQIDSIKELQKLISEEIDTVSDFEKQVTKELKEVEDLKSNIQLIIDQMESVRKLSELRLNFVNRLMSEKIKRPSEIDFEQCEKWLSMVSEIDSELKPLVNSVYNELQRLYVNETHFLYEKSKENQKIMLAIDEKARTLTSEIRTIVATGEALDDEIKKFVEEIGLIEAERSIRPVKKEFKGFNV